MSNMPESNESYVDAFVIVNESIKRMRFPLSCLKVNDNGDFYYEDDYGTGACHWSVISHPSEAFDRQMRDNVLWAKERLEWAQVNNPKEVSELNTVIKSNGYSRLTDLLNRFKGITECF